VTGGVTGVARHCERLARHEQLDAHVKQRVALLVMVRNLDDDSAAEDVVGDAAEPLDPAARGHLGGDAVGHSTELDVDLHDDF
jgi:hypothetical protein